MLEGKGKSDKSSLFGERFCNNFEFKLRFKFGSFMLGRFERFDKFERFGIFERFDKFGTFEMFEMFEMFEILEMEFRV